MRRMPDTTLLVCGPRGDVTQATVGYRSVFPTSRGTSYIEESCLFATRPSAFINNTTDLVHVSSREFAYRHQHILRITLPSEVSSSLSPAVSGQTSSPNQSYHLHFPNWVVHRLSQHDFVLPAEIQRGLLVLSIGQQTSITLRRLETSEEIRLSLGVLQNHSPLPSASRPRLSSMLWCTVHPSTQGIVSLDAQMSALTLQSAGERLKAAPVITRLQETLHP
ncbi:hypothetical protein PYCCODRAFT_703617 [Trametes coccinea BRFM310]|uniref:Uncharacterized protein n=1 Tax=Trametes coccinea (strain BRFM310) TaxID=1353009 RepID=A0A1Y2IGU8_TRAC3|nr:hypothetical protein PYCCODRAFT_703617 [Trametes coccinea BRFM310]